MKRSQPEVIIVGAGPAGSALALTLARAGRDVLILEKSRFPRDKPCGDCVNPGAVSELRALGIADWLSAKLKPRLLRGWRVEASDGSAFRAAFGRAKANGSSRLDDAALGWTVRRSEFDAALLAEAQRAGARVEFGLRVFDLVTENGRVAGVIARCGESHREIRGSLVVGADGLRSAVRHRLKLAARRPRLRKIALVGHLVSGNGTGSFGELRVRGGHIVGYASYADGANVTLVVPQEEAVAVSGDTRAFFLDALLKFPEVRERVMRCGLDEAFMVTGPFDYPVSRPWAPGVLLVGDAAGYYDPFTGQGIYQALRTACLAAQAIESALTDPRHERSALRRYGRRVRRELTPTRAVQRVIEFVIGHPDLMSFFVQALAGGGGGSPRRLLRVTGDLAHPLALAHPQLWMGLLYHGLTKSQSRVQGERR